ncbi:MAG: DUF4349 domain-containing protein [Eubacteriales bacterium]
MKRHLKRVLILLLAAVTLTACAKSGTDNISGNAASAPSVSYGESTEIKDSGIDSILSDDVAVTDSRKLIRTVELSLETKDFDSLIADLNARTAELGGYVESSRITGNSYGIDGSRYASMVIRVPAADADTLLSHVGESANIVSQSSNVSDVTLNYVDITSRIRSLEAERDALQAMLETATNTDTLLKIRSQLTDVQYSLDSYKSSLLQMESKIDYTTINLSIIEVKVYTETEELSVWEQIGTGLVNSLKDVGAGFVAFFVWLIVNLPYLIIIAALVVLAVFVVRKILKKSRKNRQEQMQSYQDMMNNQKKDS